MVAPTLRAGGVRHAGKSRDSPTRYRENIRK